MTRVSDILSCQPTELSIRKDNCSKGIKRLNVLKRKSKKPTLSLSIRTIFVLVISFPIVVLKIPSKIK